MKEWADEGVDKGISRMGVALGASRGSDGVGQDRTGNGVLL